MGKQGEGALRGVGSRVLYTGKESDLMDMLMELLQEQYVQTKCPPYVKELATELERVQPQAVVIYLEGESQVSLQAYRILEKDPRYVNTSVVVISEEEADCKRFTQSVSVKRLTLLPHPTDVTEIMERIQDAVAPVVVFGEPGDDQEEKKETATDGEAATPKVSPAATIASVAVPASDKATILVVDDDVLMLNTIKSFLQDFYDVTVVPSGKLALKFLAKKNADLVLLDYMMPDMDGPAVLQHIREESSCREVPVLFLTGVAEKDLVLRGLSYLPEGYLLKPIKREALLERVMEILLEL